MASRAVIRFIERVQRYVGKPWYVLLCSLLAMADLALTVIPTDPILISAVILRPKKWLRFSFFMTVGSALGVLGLAALLIYDREAIMKHVFPHLFGSPAWEQAVRLLHHYGSWAIGLVALTPLPQQPLVILSALSGLPLASIAGLYFVGRLTKFLLLGWLASHTPAVLLKIPGLGKDFKALLAQEAHLDPQVLSKDRSSR
jgi:membrane protein YqaA with SNARE-associated domain